MAFVAFVLLGLPWLFGSPRFSGPDELGIARRAAAVVRGQLVGEVDEEILFVSEVEVPAGLGILAEESSNCWAANPLPEGRIVSFEAPTSTCPEHQAVGGTERALTVQYRGQPFYFAVIGAAGALGTGGADPILMRLAGLVATSALLASAALSCAGARRPRLAGLALLAAWTPATAYLSATMNPSGLEVAAAIGAWAAGTRLATDRHPDPALLHRLGAALTVLVLARGLGPVFAVGTLVLLGALAGGARCREVVAERVLRRWTAAVAAAALASIAWVIWIQASHGLHENVGIGARPAAELLPWYLRQATVVFGSNTVALPTWTAFAWWAAAVAVAVVALRSASPRARVVSGLAALSGAALNVTAAGLVLPNIGFYWQGRYALPVWVGAVVVAAIAAEAPASDAAAGSSRRPLAVGPAVWAAVVGLGCIHFWAFLRVAAFTAGRTDPLAIPEVLRGAGWQPPGGFAALSVLLVVGLVATAVATIAVSPGPPGDVPAMDDPMPKRHDEPRVAG